MDSNMTRQVVRVDRDSQEEITPFWIGKSKDTEQDMHQMVTQDLLSAHWNTNWNKF